MRARRRPARFLTAAVLALVMGATACTSSEGTERARTPSATSSATPVVAPSENPVVGFDVRGGDAFAWSEVVRGTAQCAGLGLFVDGTRSRAKIARQGSSFRARVPLGPGPNRVVAKCSGSGGAAETSAPLVWNERLRAGPTANIHVSTTGGGVVLDGSHSTAAEPDGAKVVGYAWHEDARHPSNLTLASGKRLSGTVHGPRLLLAAPGSDGEYYVSLTVTDARGRTDTSTTYFVVRRGVPSVVDMMRSHPSWIDSAVIYAPIPQLWGDGGPKSIQAHLQYLKKLGVDALWLWPPVEQRAYGEEYKITNYFKLDPSWGPPSAFKAMVDAAHRLGMHVLIDFVPNHTSVRNPYYQDAQKYGEASHYYHFYQRDKHGKVVQYTQIFGTSGLPNLNYDNPEVRRMIIGACLHWIRDYGIDGFRVDAAWGVQRRRPTYWAQWRAALKRVDPDLLLLGEASAVDPHIFRGFDLAYDWTDHPGQWEWQGVFDFPIEAGSLLRPAITNAPRGYPKDALVMRFLNNNDTNPKFIVSYGQYLTRVAATLQFTLPGVPEVWAGDEIGATYETYSNLTPISWRDPHHLRPLYRRLISLRRRLVTLSSRRLEILDVSADSTFAYLRPKDRGGPPVLVLLNFGDKQPGFSATMTPDVKAAVRGGAMQDLLTGKPVRLHVHGNRLSHPMAPRSMYVLVPGAG